MSRCRCRPDSKYGRKLREESGQCEFCHTYYNKADVKDNPLGTKPVRI